MKLFPAHRCYCSPASFCRRLGPAGVLLAGALVAAVCVPSPAIGTERGPAGLRAAARAAVLRGDLAGALDLYRQAVQRDPHDATLETELGAVFDALHRPLDALASMRSALQIEPGNQAAEIGTAKAYQQIHNFVEAKKWCAQAAHDHPQSAAPYTALGEIDLELQGYDAAQSHLERALDLDPADGSTRVDLAVASQAKGDLAGALRELDRAIGDDARLPAAYYFRASIHKERNENEVALKDAKRATELDPANPRTRLLLGELETLAGKCSEAVGNLRPLAGSAGGSSQALYLLARAYQCAGKAQLAAATMNLFAARSGQEHAEKARKQQADSLVAQAGEAARKNQLQPALDLLRQALALDQGNGHALAQLAKIQFSEGKMDAARDAIERAIKTDPYQSEYLYVLGRVLEAQGHFAEALEAFERTTAIDPSESDAYYEMGAIYSKLRDRNRAEQALEKALELSPSDPDYQQALEKLRRE